MTVAELMEYLSEMPQDAEVRLAHQPSWPFEYSIDRYNGVVEVEVDEEPVVYIAEGTQLGYLPGEAKEWLNW